VWGRSFSDRAFAPEIRVEHAAGRGDPLDDGRVGPRPGRFESLTGHRRATTPRSFLGRRDRGIASPPSAIVRLIPARRRPLRLVEDQVAVPDVIVDLEGNVVPGACPVDLRVLDLHRRDVLDEVGGVTANVDLSPRASGALKRTAATERWLK